MACRQSSPLSFFPPARVRREHEIIFCKGIIQLHTDDTRFKPGIKILFIDFENIIRALNDIGYNGPLSVEWEDSGMDREAGAEEACDFVRFSDFTPSDVAFDDAMQKE